MLITCREYNRRWREEHLGYVVRYFCGKWVVCDGYAPDCDSEVDEKSIFCGYIVKEFDTADEALELQKILNT